MNMDPSQPTPRLHNEADDHLARLYNEDVEAPWYGSFISNVKEFFNPPKLPPLEVTSQPVAVKDIWGLYGRQKKSWMVSTGFQATSKSDVTGGPGGGRSRSRAAWHGVPGTR